MKLRIRTRIALWALAAFSVLLVLQALLFLQRSKQILYALVDETVREDFNEIGHYLGTPGLEEFLRFEMATDPENNEVFFEIRDPDGTGLVLSDNLGGGPIPRTQEGVVEKGIGFRDEPHPRYADRGWKIRVGEAVVDGYPVQVGVTLHPIQRAFAQLQMEAGLFIVLFGLLATVGAAGVASRALEPLKRIVRTARQLSLTSDGELPARGTGDEIDELADVLNGLIRRVRTHVRRIRQFTADAAHELRTPLTAIRGHLELLHPRLDPEGQEVVGGVVEEVDRLGSLVKQLLLLERLESQEAGAELKPIDLAETAREVVDHLRVLAAERQITIRCETEPVWVNGDPAQLRQLFFNLLDNALKFGRPSGDVGVRVHPTDGQAEAIVWDDGPGFAPEEADRIFERFYSNRDRYGAGIGLGLPIARAIAERHGGTLSTRSAARTEFILRLPASFKANPALIFSSSGCRSLQDVGESTVPVALREERKGQEPKAWVANPLRRSNLRLRVLGPVLVGAGVVALADPTPLGVVLGLPLILGGEALRVWATGHLVKTDQLTISGPYAYLRHPLYLGTLTIGCGFGLLAGATIAIVAIPAFLLVFFGYYFPRKERIEGERLERLYGEPYRVYRAEVRSLFPSLRPWRRGSATAPPRWRLERFLDNSELGTLLVVAMALLAIGAVEFLRDF